MAFILPIVCHSAFLAGLYAEFNVTLIAEKVEWKSRMNEKRCQFQSASTEVKYMGLNLLSAFLERYAHTRKAWHRYKLNLSTSLAPHSKVAGFNSVIEQAKECRQQIGIYCSLSSIGQFECDMASMKWSCKSELWISETRSSTKVTCLRFTSRAGIIFVTMETTSIDAPKCMDHFKWENGILKIGITVDWVGVGKKIIVHKSRIMENISKQTTVNWKLKTEDQSY